MESRLNQYRPNPDGNQPKREGGKDYSAMLSSIRAEQGPKAFVDGLHQNKDQLLSLAQHLMLNRGATPEDGRAYVSAGIYLDAVLKIHVFDIDPFASKRPGDEQVQEDRAAVANEIVRRVALKRLRNHPDSGAAIAVRDSRYLCIPVGPPGASEGNVAVNSRCRTPFDPFTKKRVVVWRLPS